MTRSMQQQRRVADRVAFMLLGALVETGPTEAVFTAAHDTRTDD